MRPVKKLSSGDSIKLLDGAKHSIRAKYKPYSDAKNPLVANIGEYCSYCEKPASDEAVHIEHIQPKDIYKNLEFKWSNFLLACQRCNGSDNKGKKDVVLNNIHLPHLNNSMLSIQYGIGGIVQIHPKLTPNTTEYQKAKALIDLVGLDKRPGHNNCLPKDKRWMKRDNVWNLALRYVEKLNKKETDIECITDLAESRGFFSVWFTVFKDYPNVRGALIKRFKGTPKKCFDEDNNFEPIPRNTPNI